MTGGIPAFDKTNGKPSDVCLIVEGCYPHIAGGVSTWVDWLIKSQPDVSFRVISIVAPGEERKARYAFPPNVVAFREVVLGQAPGTRFSFRRWLAPLVGQKGLNSSQREQLAHSLCRFVLSGRLDDLQAIFDLVRSEKIELADILHDRHTFDIVCATYQGLMPYGVFEDFFWAWHSLMGGLFSILKSPLEPSSIYHAISTGYAGLLLARAKLEYGAKAIVTEHGIYTNERRIELLMADWLVDTIDNGYRLDRNRLDLRDVWVRTFESYARACYEAADRITTLYSDNQPMQVELGADSSRLEVIPNGIDFERFASIPEAPDDARPTVALIGRVVPIKDVKTFIAAIDRLRHRVPNVRALVAGPTDEDAAYAAECMSMCKDLGLTEILTFTGRVNVVDLLREVHVMTLTSLSEAQPLTVLEAGAARRPCVTTNVGACREMLEGAPDETPHLGPGGIVTDILNADQIADALEDLIANPAKRKAYGRALQERVKRYYTTPISRARYRAVYGLPPMTEAA